jgi:4-hydroxy-2-oxoheptanedioate aldolase
VNAGSDARPFDDGFAARVRAGKTLYGLLVKMPAPAIVELGGYIGFDFVVLDTEHGVSDSSVLEHHVRAADGAGVASLVRVGSSEPIETLRALDAGATGIVFPHIHDAVDAQAAVRTAHYPPVGKRGFAVSTRAGRHGQNGVAEHARLALENTVVVVQVEDAAALEHVTDIASLERVDAIFLGPNDLSLSLGHPGNLNHPEVMAAVDKVVASVNEIDGTALCVLAGSEREARGWEERGARLVLFVAIALLGERLGQVITDLRSGENLVRSRPAPDS